MNKIIAFSLFLSGLTIQIHGQVIRTLSGQNMEDLTSRNQQFLFQDFTDGSVLYKNGSSARGKMNYNLVVGELRFIDPANGQQMALANPGDVVLVAISGRHFIPLSKSGEFLEIIENGTVALAVRRKTIAQHYGKEGAYGTINTASSIETINTVSDGSTGKTENISTVDYQTLSTTETYYLVVNGKPQLISNKKSLLNAYQKGIRPLIEQYMTDANVSVKDEQTLIMLTKYGNTLLH